MSSQRQGHGALSPPAQFVLPGAPQDRFVCQQSVQPTLSSPSCWYPPLRKEILTGGPDSDIKVTLSLHLHQGPEKGAEPRRIKKLVPKRYVFALKDAVTGVLRIVFFYVMSVCHTVKRSVQLASKRVLSTTRKQASETGLTGCVRNIKPFPEGH